MDRTRKPPPSPIAKATLIATSVLVAVVAQEYAVRLAMPQFDPAGHLRFIDGTGDTPRLGEPGTIQRQIKNTGDFDVTVRFNKYGLRDSKDLARSAPDDWFMVGDSMAFGWGVEEGSRVSDRLATMIGKPVYNIAVNGDFNHYERLLEYARRKGAKLGRVMVFVNTGNDLMIYRGNRFGSRKAVARRIPGTLIEIKQFLLNHSALYFAATTVIQRNPVLRPVAVRLGVIAEVEQIDRAVAEPDRVSKSSANRLQALMARYPGTVVLAPSVLLWTGARQVANRRMYDDFLRRLRARGLDVVDLLPAIEAGGAPLAHHFATDAHWNPAGHAAAARAIADHIRLNAGR